MYYAAPSTRCHRCGGLLGMGKTTLYLSEAGPQADEIARDPARALGLLRQQLGRRHYDGGLLKRLLLRLRSRASSLLMAARMRDFRFVAGYYAYAPLGPDYQKFCQRCGEHSIEGRAAAHHSGGANVLERLMSRLGRSRPLRALRRRSSLYTDAEGRVDMSKLLAGTAFGVYGFKGAPLGLRLRDVHWSVRGDNADYVGFRYAAEGPSGHRRAVELSQGIDIVGRSDEGRLARELQDVISLVMSCGELRQEYLHRGNVHRDWNLQRMSRTERRRLTVHINGTPVEVELAYWWKPELVALAHMTLDGRPVSAAAIGTTHIELLTLLKTITALRGDPEAAAEHREGYEEARAYRVGRG